MEGVFNRMHSDIEEFLRKTPMCEGVKLKYNYSINSPMESGIEEVYDERKTRSSSISSVSSVSSVGKKRSLDDNGFGFGGGSSAKLRRSSRIAEMA